MNKSIEIEKGIITTIRLNRPEVHNALNKEMITELTVAFTNIPNDSQVRAIILRGNGKSFCAGADLNYMKDIAGFGFDQNYEDGKRLAGLFKAIYNCTVPTIAVVHGAAFGGANGLLSTCDIVLAEETTTFAFSEVKLGIGPATIAPFVIKRIGEFNARDLMLTGRRFKGQEAQKTGLVTHCLSADVLEEKLESITREFLTSAPGAARATKSIIIKILSENMKMQDEIEYTATQIAELRQSDEGQDGMSAFFEKRKPGWVTKNQND